MDCEWDGERNRGFAGALRGVIEFGSMDERHWRCASRTIRCANGGAATPWLRPRSCDALVATCFRGALAARSLPLQTAALAMSGYMLRGDVAATASRPPPLARPNRPSHAPLVPLFRGSEFNRTSRDGRDWKWVQAGERFVLVLVLVLGFSGHFEDENEWEEPRFFFAPNSPGFNHTLRDVRSKALLDFPAAPSVQTLSPLFP